MPRHVFPRDEISLLFFIRKQKVISAVNDGIRHCEVLQEMLTGDFFKTCKTGCVLSFTFKISAVGFNYLLSK